MAIFWHFVSIFSICQTPLPPSSANVSICLTPPLPLSANVSILNNNKKPSVADIICEQPLRLLMVAEI